MEADERGGEGQITEELLAYTQLVTPREMGSHSLVASGLVFI